MIRSLSIAPLLVSGIASLALLAACQKSEPAPVDAAAEAVEPPVAEVAAADAESSASVDAPPAGPRGDGPRPPRGPQTLEQMQARAEERFARLDADHDGVVTTAELDAAGGRGGRMLARSDADSDGRITRAEARAGTADIFRRMDANADGVVSEDERPQWGGRGGPGGPPQN